MVVTVDIATTDLQEGDWIDIGSIWWKPPEAVEISQYGVDDLG
jgi:hypothetical protein